MASKGKKNKDKSRRMKTFEGKESICDTELKKE